MIYDPSSKLDNNTEYLSNVDILPTLADLFNFEYIYSEGKSAFDDSRPGIIKWLGINKFGMLGEDLVYTGDENQKIGAELETGIENDKEQAAKLYSLFY